MTEFTIDTSEPKELMRLDPDGKLHVHAHVYHNYEEIVELLMHVIEVLRALPDKSVGQES